MKRLWGAVVLAVATVIGASVIAPHEASATDIVYRRVPVKWDSTTAGVYTVHFANGINDTMRTRKIGLEGVAWDALPISSDLASAGVNPFALGYVEFESTGGAAGDTLRYSVEVCGPTYCNHNAVLATSIYTHAVNPGNAEGSRFFRGPLYADPDATPDGGTAGIPNLWLAQSMRLRVHGDISGGVNTAVRCYVVLPFRASSAPATP